MNEQQATEAIRELFSGSGSWWSYPDQWNYDAERHDIKTIALDGSFTLVELEKLVSILKLVEVRGEK